MASDLLGALLVLGGVFLVLCCISAGLLCRFSAGALTLQEGFFISLLAYIISTVPFTLYGIAKRPLGIPPTFDGLATIAWMCLTGWVMTRRARTYGVEKKGWFGVGAKTMFSFLLLSWALVGIYFVYSIVK